MASLGRALETDLEPATQKWDRGGAVVPRPGRTPDDSGIHPRIVDWPALPASDVAPIPRAASVTTATTTVRSHTSNPSVGGWLEAESGLAKRVGVLAAWRGAGVTAGEATRIARAASALSVTIGATREFFQSALWSAASDAAPLAHGSQLAESVGEVHRWIALVVEELEEYVALADAGEETWGVAGRSFTEESALHVLCQVEPHLAALPASEALRTAVACVHEELRARI